MREGFRLLMVDDSPDDAFFVQRALEKSGVGCFFYAVNDGAAALAYLRGEGKYSDRNQFPFPNLLLVDLKMPGMNGFDLLRWLQSHAECKVIPTIAFSSSCLETDVHQVYVLGGNAFLMKPSSLPELVDLIRVTFQFWSRCQTPAPPPGQHCS